MPATQEPVDARAFPCLDEREMQLLAEWGATETLRDGQTAFRAGDADIDFFVVQEGALEILNPTDGNSHVVTHGPGHFVGDIDLLTRRPVIVTAMARGPTRVLRVPGEKLRNLLNSVPRLSDKILIAFQVRRELLQQQGTLGLKVIGPAHCADTNIVREFLYKNFMPFKWYDSDQPEGLVELKAIGSPTKTPAIECGDGKILLNPKLRELAKCAGIWRECPDAECDLAIVGAGPAGIAAAVYAASEGLKTIVLDRLGPGGQAGGSSKIENFIGFPAGLSGNDLATRGVLQMLKFGAQMIAPIDVDRLEPGATADAPLGLHLDCGTVIHASTVLIATGVAWRKLQARGADRFERAGVYYACTAVESRPHEGTDVAVVGAGNSAGQAAMYLAEHCAKTVHLLIRRDNLGTNMSDYLAERILGQRNIRVHTGVEVDVVNGSSQIESIELRRRPDDGSRQKLACSAIFVFIGAEPHGSWLPDTVARDNLGYIVTGVDAVTSGRWPLKDRDPCPLETTLPRVMAAGDVRSGSTKRVGFAVGDGSLAVTCAHRLRLVKN